VGIVFKNNAKTTLASNLSNSATSATVTDGSVFPSLSAGEFFLLTFDDGTNNEICKCTARSGNTLTIVRAQEGTTARAFSSGDAAEGRVTAGVLETIQENIAAKSANQTVYNATTASSATDYDIGIDPSVEANAMVFLNGVMQHHDTFSFSGSTLTFDAAPPNGMALEVIVDNLINLQSSNLTVDTFTATSGQTDFVLSDTPAAETNLIVFVDGVFQDQDSYTISNNTLTITDGVVLNRGVTVYVINPVNIGTPSDGTVTSAKLSGNITMPGTLTVGSNDVAFDSPTFVVDNANSRVGLGTASPSVPVDIVGDVKMSANLTVDTSTLHVDSTNNRVGIGNTSPENRLHVKGAANTSTTVQIESASSQYAPKILFDGIVGASADYLLGSIEASWDTHTNKVAAIRFESGSDTTNKDDGLISFWTSDASSTLDERMRIDSGGRVMIGTSSNSGVSNNADNLIVGDNTSATEQGITLCSTLASGIRWNDGADAGLIEYVHSNNRMTFYTSGAERMRITSGGILDIGKASFSSYPTGSKLNVYGDGEGIRLDGTGATTRRIRFRNVGAGTGPGEIVADGSLIIKNEDANAYLNLSSIRNIEYQVTSGNGTAGHHIFTSYNTEIMRIDGANNRVGIGTDTPAKKLEIFGSGSENGILVKNDTNTNYRGYYIGSVESDNTAYGKLHMDVNSGELNITSGYSGWGGFITFDANGSERMRITGSGEVGIGLGGSAPQGRLEIRVPEGDGGFMIGSSSSTANQNKTQMIQTATTLSGSNVWKDVAYVGHSGVFRILGKSIQSSNTSYGGAAADATLTLHYGSASITHHHTHYQAMNGGDVTGNMEYRYLNSGATNGNYRLQVRMPYSGGTHVIYTSITGISHDEIYEDDA